MGLNIQNITLEEKDGMVVAYNTDVAAPERVRHVWFDTNCPYCRRHWLDNMEEYLNEIRAGRLSLEMTPVKFLTEYSIDTGALLLATVPYGAELYFDVFISAIFHGVSESYGNDESVTGPKLREIYGEIITPVLKDAGVTSMAFEKSLEDAYEKVIKNTDEAVNRGINSVPHIDDRKV